MDSYSGILFTPFRLGPVLLRNRTIRAAAFEGMCPGNMPSEELINYHRIVAAGGIGMTTVAYAAVERSGLSFPHQLLLDEKALKGLTKLTDSVHKEGASCSIQIGHCGNMADKSIAGTNPLAPTSRFNLYGPTFPIKMQHSDIQRVVKSFGNAVKLAIKSGFDAVEIHAGHGYLISQFLSPYTNRRKDSFGGSLENRSRFLHLVMDEVKNAAVGDIAILVKTNMNDGFKNGISNDDALKIAAIIENAGANALVLSGGFVSRAPMYVMRGSMPVKILAHFVDNPIKKTFIRLFGKLLIREVQFRENYFLEEAKRFREVLKLPLIYVGGLLSRENINEVLNNGFELVAIARALIKDPDFVKKLEQNKISKSSCDTCNYCIAVMYSKMAECIQNDEKIDTALKKMLYQ